MYNNEYMYAIERSDEYLAHYGVRGMKWGIRNAMKADGASRSKKLSKQYAKAQKKLAKLEKRANNGAKYARRASRLGAGAALAGGLAIAGTSGVAKASQGLGKGLHAVGNLAGAYGRTPGKINPIKRLSTKAAVGIHRAGNTLTKAGSASGAINTWGNSNSIGQALKTGGRKLQNAVPGNITAKLTGGKGIVSTTDKLGKVSNNTFARIGAGAVGAGLAAGAMYNQHRAKTTDKAAKKAAEFKREMNRAFKGTQYASGGNNGSNKPRQGKKRRR